MIKLVCDLGGADKSSSELFTGILEAIEKCSDLEVDLYVNDKELCEHINDLHNNRLICYYCDDVITNNDIPTQAIREKTNSTLVKALTKTAHDNDISGIVSIGSTGAVLVGSIMILGRIDKCRPALAAVLPNENGYFCLCDCGANVDCKSEHLVGFAKMGTIYMKTYFHIDNPRVGLISNGSEDKKGNQLTKETHELLSKAEINFIGNIEGTKVLNDSIDVLVCDGFDGNILLKNIEGTVKTIIKDIYSKIKDSTDENEKKVLKELIKHLLNKYDFNSLGGAILLGVNKIVVKAHGSGDNETIKNTLLQAYKLAKNNLIDKIKKL